MPIEQKHIQALSALEFKARQVVEGFLAGLHKSPFHGFSVEFAEHRAYNQGESTRHIDWKLYARTDKLYTKRYEEETNLRCQLVVDTSSSMYYPDNSVAERSRGARIEFNKVEFAVHAAAAFIQLLRKQRDAVGLTTFSDSVHIAEQARSNAVHLRHLMQHLEDILSVDAPSRGQTTSVVEALNDIARRAHRRSLVVILSDMLDGQDREEEVFDALQHLRFNKHDIILFHVVDRKHELELDLQDRPYTFVDVETKEEVKAHPSEVRDAYKAAMKERWHQLKLKCGQYRIDLVEADINKGFEPLLLEFLTKRARLY
ncbi:MAG: DUF58 domain-containing protein [Flavobacteriales bacterium]|nr:DUF58 domain-containing protein [Flavobacteriales bacterium]MBK6945635.1 DUF58 domain-containing protein [Flavobacteriales bacterium]MBK7241742.1 DUF58 domain-containing protein [Flavobacteriales bacterium]MBK7296257.1 DUF58 domain-containing protein [Flavobacteriales bacterium]MBK9534813.1 DUF58 domain-containing protein [Flavobacteriales bacterium]